MKVNKVEIISIDGIYEAWCFIDENGKIDIGIAVGDKEVEIEYMRRG